MNDALVAGGVIYITVTAAVFLGGAVTAKDYELGRWGARIALLSPFWPIMALVAFGLYLSHLWRLAWARGEQR